MTYQRDLFTNEVIPDRRRKLPRPQQKNGFAHGSGSSTNGEVKELIARISSLEHTISELREIMCQQNRPSKDSYSTAEVASILGKKPYTVREWCRLQRIHAFKAMCGRGCEEEWRVSHEELVRIQNDGLLPIPDKY